MNLSLAFSPCPNDTFIFDALVNNKIDTKGLSFSVMLEDVETLNKWTLQQKCQFSKVSYGVLPLILENYTVLQSGGALGKGVGPLLISKNIEEISEKTIVALPGKNTTAHLLFSMAYPNISNKIFMPFNEIEEWLLTQNNHDIAGVIIHENRFTYQDKGLKKIKDLGKFWEQKTNAPIPLGGIVAHKSVEKNIILLVDDLIKQSVKYAFKTYPILPNYVKEHAQEMSEAVMKQHIDLYVNNFSKKLGVEGENAVKQLLKIYTQHNLANDYKEDDIFIH